MSKPLSFQKLHNIRDLGGMETCDGRHIKPGLLLRSGHLSGLERSDREALEKLVGMVIDFRTEKERQENPDDSLAGTAYQSISILDRLTEGITREEEADQKIFAKFLTQPAQAKAYMIGMYRLQGMPVPHHIKHPPDHQVFYLISHQNSNIIF